MSIIWIVLGLILLVVGGEFLVRSSVAISLKFNTSKLVIGMTVVSFATSAPEFLVSLQAALKGASDIALGNVIGSNIANIGLILGITVIISPLVVDKSFYKLNWLMMLLLSVALYFMLESGNVLNRWEGAALFSSLIIFLYVLIRRAKRENLVENDVLDGNLKLTSGFKLMVWLLIGAVSLYYGSEWLVLGARDLATTMGISERVISVTMVAVGTSIPELAASVIAALKRENAISLGNLIGSNIFNISGVLGVTAMIQPILVKSDEILSNDMIWMIAIAFVLLPIAFIPKINQLGRLKGLVLLSSYLLFTFLIFYGE